MGADRPPPDWEQDAARRDRAAGQRDEDAAARDDLAAERDRSSGGRDALASDREQAAHERERAALARDWEATARDHAAERRDRAASRRVRPTDATRVGRFEQAAVDRELDASDRQAAAEDRAAAAADRAAAASDERAAAADRAAAVEDRDMARRDRVVAAQDRKEAAGNRDQAEVERAQHGYVPTPGGLPFRRVQAAWGRARETAQAAAEAAAGLAERFIQAKQRELAAHLASVEVYEQLASLQEGLGHPDRAAEARAKAKRARELHRAAGAELAEYRAKIKAVEDRRARRRSEGTGTGRAVG
jgi:hypothetical protein